MPAPDQACQQSENPFFEKMRESMRGGDNNDLAREIAGLRVEIADLRALLAPAPSLILTGHQVIAEFKMMTHNESDHGNQ